MIACLIIITFISTTSTWYLNTSTIPTIPCCLTTCVTSNIQIGFNNIILNPSDALFSANSIIQTCNSTAIPTTAFYIHFQGAFPLSTNVCTLFQASDIGLFDITLISGSIYFENGPIIDIPSTPISLYLQMIINSSQTIITVSYLSSSNGFAYTKISSNIFTPSSSNWKMLVDCPGAELISIEYGNSATSACKQYCTICTPTANCSQCQDGYYIDSLFDCQGIILK